MVVMPTMPSPRRLSWSGSILYQNGKARKATARATATSRPITALSFRLSEMPRRVWLRSVKTRSSRPAAATVMKMLKGILSMMLCSPILSMAVTQVRQKTSPKKAVLTTL